MVITSQELIKMYKESEDLEEEVAGIKKFVWDLTTYSKNVDVVKHKMEVLLTHITEELSRVEKLIENEKMVVDQLKKHGFDIESNPLGTLYKGSLEIRESFKKIISVISIQLDVLSIVNEKLVSLLDEIKKFGFEKQKIEFEVEILKNTVEYLKSFMDYERNYRKQIIEDERKAFFSMIEESRKNNAEVISKIALLIEGIMNIKSSDIETIKSAVKELENIKSRLNSIENDLEEIKNTPREIEKNEELKEGALERREYKSKKKENIYEVLKKIIVEEGITDKVEAVERLREMGYDKVNIEFLRRHGFIDLVKRFGNREKEIKREIEPAEDLRNDNEDSEDDVE